MATDILQISDLHLLCESGATLKGVPTRDTLTEVLQFIDREVRSGKWDFQWVVITGDMAHDEQHATYKLLRELLGDRLPRCRLIPGNHDNRESIRLVFPELVSHEGSYINFSVEAAGWRLIGLDSHVPGEGAGRIDAEQLAWLEEELAANSTQPTILFIHHPPFSVHSAWLDEIGLRDPQPLIDLVQSFPFVRVICTGHVHQQYEDRHAELDFLTTPSIAVQFRPHTDTLECDPIPPGFRIFNLAGDAYKTQVVRLPELRFPPISS